MAQGKRRLEYLLLKHESHYDLVQQANVLAKEDYRIVIGTFQATTFGYFLWMERFSQEPA